MFNNYIAALETEKKHLKMTLTDLQYKTTIELTCNNESANDISSPIEVVLIKEEIHENCVFEDGNDNVLAGEEAMEKNDEFSNPEKPENLNENVKNSSSLNEEHYIVQNFVNRVKKETGLYLIPEEVQIKDECLFEAADSDSEDKTNNKFQNEWTNMPDYNSSFSEGYKNKEMDQNVDSVKRFKCDKCHETFLYPSFLKRHYHIHTGERPFKCTTCNKTFSHSSSLSLHTRTHTGEKPYKCDVCRKTFNQMIHLRVHIRIHNNERPFKCSVCHKTFTKSDQHSQHMRIHTGEKPFKCELCQYQCSQVVHLKTHMRTHSGEKPYQCHVCQHKCTTAGNLKMHMRIHTGEKPFTCKHCQISFSTSSSLKRHIQIHL